MNGKLAIAIVVALYLLGSFLAPDVHGDPLPPMWPANGLTFCDHQPELLTDGQGRWWFECHDDDPLDTWGDPLDADDEVDDWYNVYRHTDFDICLSEFSLQEVLEGHCRLIDPRDVS